MNSNEQKYEDDDSCGGSDKEERPASEEGGCSLWGKRGTSTSRDEGRGGEGIAQSSLSTCRDCKRVTENNTYRRDVLHNATCRHQSSGAVPPNSDSGGEKTGGTTNKNTPTAIMEAHSIPEQSSDDISAGPPMTTLRRSQPNVFARASESELRQPHQRLVKVEPDEGQMQPGAYAHRPPRHFSVTATGATGETTLEGGVDSDTNFQQPSFAAYRTRMGVTGAPFTDEGSLRLSLYGAPNFSIGMDRPVVGMQKHLNTQCLYCLVCLLIVLSVVAVGVGVGVGSVLFGSTSDETAWTNNECSIAEIEQQCPNSTATITVLPECILKLRGGLMSRLPSNTDLAMNATINECSAENLALLSVALYQSNEDSPITLTNRLGLSLLFYATNGREWTKGSDWASSKPYCEWEGVSCNENEPGAVTNLVMEFFNMEGILPARVMSFLPELASLSIMGNSLTGNLAPEFHALDELSASANVLTGTLAPAFFESTSLQVLDLSRNGGLTASSIPFLGTQWKKLALEGTTVDGDFLSSVLVLSNLDTLLLSRTNLVGTLPTEIGQLTSLTNLELFENPLLGGKIPTELQNLTKLQYLLLNDCRFSGSIPSELGKMTDLLALLLHGNRLNGGMPTELGHLSKLATLWFYDNFLEGTIPPEVCALKIDGDLEVLGASCFMGCEADPYGGLICPPDQHGCCT